MPKHGYVAIWDEDLGENVLISYDVLEPELAKRLKMVLPVGGFCYAAEDFVGLPLSPAPFYVGNGWLPKQGKAEIFAPPKSGKSFLCVQLARCIGAGEAFLGIATQQGKVLYLQFELAPEMLQQRMKESGQEYPEVFVGTTFSMKLDKRAGQEDLIKAMDVIKPKVLILDPFREVFSGDENTAQDVGVFIDFLDDIIDTYQCSIIIIHHSGKDQNKGGRGSSVLEGWVDSYIQMKRKSKKGEALRIELTPLSLRHAQLPPSGVGAQLVNGEFVVLGEDDKPKLIIDKVWEYCEHHDEFRSSEIHAAGLGSRAPVQVALNQLIEQGKIERFKLGWYRRT
uniref:Putative ATPase domain containing protein n=1 Tax=viral metagenome TaxID=1070528 RepID=A0A6H1ZKD3_9ZZZZ